MGISYLPLWKTLLDKDIKRTELIKMCKMSPCTMSRMGKGLGVSIDVLYRICEVLDCNIEDVIEFKRESSN